MNKQLNTKRNPNRVTLLSVFTVVGVLFFTIAPQQARADKAEAQKLLSEGNTLLQAGNNAGALVKFEAAYEAYPSPSLLLNIGTTLRALGRNAEAANAYARWIRAKQSPERQAEVDEALTELDKIVGAVTIVVNQIGAAVTVDGKSINADALRGAIRLEPGSHTVAASKKGFREDSKQITVSAGQKQDVTLELEADGTEAPTTTETPEEPVGSTDDPEDTTVSDSSAGSGLRYAGLGVAGAGIVSIGVGVAFGLKAKNISDDLQAQVDSNAPWSPELLALPADGEAANRNMFIFYGIGAAAIVGGGVLYYLGHSAGSAGEEDESFAITPMASPDSVGWAVSGSF